MASGSQENSTSQDDFERRRWMWRKLIEEGVLQDKPPQELTADDLETINVRLSLEDHAAAEGVSVEQMFDEWQDDSKFVHGPFTAEEMMEWLNKPDNEADEDASDDARVGKPD